MYKYKSINDDNFKQNYKKEIKKSLLKMSLSFSIGIYVLIFLVVYNTTKSNEGFNLSSYIAVGAFAIVVELIVFSIYYKKEVNNLINNIRDFEVDLSFDEQGISINSENSIRHIDWKGLRSIKVSEESLIFNYKVNGMVGNIFFFDRFEVSKETIIKDIEAYAKVRR